MLSGSCEAAVASPVYARHRARATVAAPPPVSVRRDVGLHVRRRVLQRLQCVMGTSPSACRSRDDCVASSADDSDAAPSVVSAAKIAARLIFIASAFSVAP